MYLQFTTYTIYETFTTRTIYRNIDISLHLLLHQYRTQTYTQIFKHPILLYTKVLRFSFKKHSTIDTIKRTTGLNLFYTYNIFHFFRFSCRIVWLHVRLYFNSKKRFIILCNQQKDFRTKKILRSIKTDDLKISFLKLYFEHILCCRSRQSIKPLYKANIITRWRWKLTIKL